MPFMVLLKNNWMYIVDECTCLMWTSHHDSLFVAGAGRKGTLFLSLFVHLLTLQGHNLVNKQTKRSKNV